ncbi:hypothetical protein MLD38_030066 [Melastoma candidum]|uniref:Uncharacterized protein n=1 Tax=Melastoma candidum TaxID=119954 RepID=A0ACB9MKK8_9MYRT|nr:hypothetical protein MLD38_030066 [Melastoma candidum]
MSNSTPERKRAAMNPWVLHLQKLGLELKCPLCGCLPSATESEPSCPLCQVGYCIQDLRPARHIVNIVGIYKSLDSSFSASFAQAVSSHTVKKSPDSMLIAKRSITNNLRDQAVATIQKGNLNCQRNAEADVKVGIGSGVLPKSGAETTKCNGTVRTHFESDVSHADHSSFGSPPSNSDTSVVGEDSSDLGNDLGHFKYSAKRSLDGGAREEVQIEDLKRPKLSSYGLRPMMASDNAAAQVDDDDISKSEGKQTSAPLLSTGDAFSVRTKCSSSICGFCQTGEFPEDTGEMLHLRLDNGVPVDSEAIAKSDVVHVHRSCVEWAPQAYFVGETVKNLEKELCRGSKLKCCKCGLKGAALGCYAQSCRRTYHLPCAEKESNCRWDYENFCVLCPVHTSLKLPNEKSKCRNRASKQKALSPQEVPYQPKPSLQFPSEAKSWVLCGSALSAQERSRLVKFASSIGATVSKSWSPNVTHVIASTDEKGACTRTYKVLMAILHGRWVLNLNWMKACLEAKYYVSEETYEIGVDNYGCRGGPKFGRLRASNNESKIFAGLKFYFHGDFMPAFLSDLHNLVAAGGGCIPRSKEAMIEAHCHREAPSALVVYNPDAPEGCPLGEEVSIYWKKINEAEDLATSLGARVVNPSWILESVASCKLQSVVSPSGNIAL